MRLEVPASWVGLEGKTVDGMAFTLCDGRATWDKAGKDNLFAGVTSSPINNRVYTVDAATNRLTSVNGVAMSYDAAGNQTNDGSGQRTYDAENRMLTATNGGVSSSYTYDADGQRVRRIIGAQETWQVYGIGGELLAEYAVGASPGAPQKEYGYRNGQLLVVWDGSETGDRQLQWLVQDHLGSTRMVVDRSGSLGGIRRHDYAPFGEELVAGVGIRSASNGYSNDSVRQKYGSYERDNETGLDFAQARYFSNAQGRFTGADPLLASGKANNPQTWNRYTYALNNPLQYVDPTGMESGNANPNTSNCPEWWDWFSEDMAVGTMLEENTEEEEQRQASIYVVFFTGGSYLSPNDINAYLSLEEGGQIDPHVGGLGGHFAQMIKSCNPNANVIVAGPSNSNVMTAFGALKDNAAEHVFIIGISAGAAKAILLSNLWTGNGGYVEQLITADAPKVWKSLDPPDPLQAKSLKEAGMIDIRQIGDLNVRRREQIGDAINYVGSLGKRINNMKNEGPMPGNHRESIINGLKAAYPIISNRLGTVGAR